MNKVILFFVFLFVCFSAISQPISYRASDVITVSDGRLQAQYNLFIPRYTDTTAANLKKGIDSCGALIYTYDNKLWKRNCNPKKWTEVGISSFVDTIYRVSGRDSIYYRKNGITYAIKDSIGGSSVTPSLQQVTDIGANTTNTIEIDKYGFANLKLLEEENPYKYNILNYSTPLDPSYNIFKISTDMSTNFECPSIYSAGLTGEYMITGGEVSNPYIPKLNFNMAGDFLNMQGDGGLFNSVRKMSLNPNYFEFYDGNNYTKLRFNATNFYNNEYKTYNFPASNIATNPPDDDTINITTNVNGNFADVNGTITLPYIDTIKRVGLDIYGRVKNNWVYQYTESGGGSYTPTIVPYANGSGTLTGAVSDLKYSSNTFYVGSTNGIGTENAIDLNNGRATIYGNFNGMRINVGSGTTGTIDATKGITFYNKGTRYAYFGSSGTGGVGNHWFKLDSADLYLPRVAGTSDSIAVIEASTGKVKPKLIPYIDSLKRNTGTDSVFARKNGEWNFQYKDSIGSGSSQNGRFGNDTATVVMAKVHNNSGVSLTNGKVVFLSTSGTSSEAPSVRLANNKADSTSANTFGFVTGTIAVNDTGYVILSGKIEKLNTSAFSNGDVIYLDSISGEWTKSKPKAPYHLVYLGVVVKANAGNGAIFVKPQNGYELDEIHDVQINGIANNQILVYSDTQRVWKNRVIYSVVDTVNTIATKTNVAAKVNISDTASMLSNYLRNVPTIAYLGSDFTTSSTTAVNTNLSIAVAANTAYRIMISGSASKATSSTGLKISIGAPTGTTIKANFSYGANAINTIQNAYITAINTLYPSTAFSTAIATEMPFRIEGILVTGSTAGNIVLQGATVTSNIATIYANTLMTLTKAYSQ